MSARSYNLANPRHHFALTGTLGLLPREALEEIIIIKMLLRAARVNGLLGSVVHVPVRTIKRPALNTSQVYHYINLYIDNYLLHI
jgi:hypothetical protein